MEPAAPVCGARPGVVHQGCDGAGDGSRTGSESGLQTRILVGERRQGRTAGLLRRRGRSGHRIVGHAGYAFGRRRHPFGHRRFRRRARQHRGKGVTASVPGRRTERGAHARRRPVRPSGSTIPTWANNGTTSTPATSRSIRRSRREPMSTATRLGSSARATRALSSRSWTTACSGTIPTWPPTCGPTPPS